MPTETKPANGSSTPGGLAALRHDLLPSLVVFLVALPLCMGIALASGVPVAAGLVTGIIGGLVVGLLAGAPVQVSGPAAGLSVIIYDFVQHHGLETLGIVVLLAGTLQLVAGLAGLGQWFRAVSPAVIHGMLGGVGILIFASQFHVMVDDRPKGSGLANLLSIPEAVRKGLPLPALGTAEERAARARLLKQLGTLHDNQTRVRELLGEVLPKDLPDASAASHTEEIKPLAEEQAQINERLRELARQVDELDIKGGEVAKARIQETAAEALTAGQAALSDLREGRAETARQTQQSAADSYLALFDTLKSHDWAAKLGILTILIIVLWKTLAPKPLQLVPSALLAVIAGSAVAAILTLPVLYVETPDNLLADLHFPSLAVIQESNWLMLLQGGVLIAAVASAETLLCASATDQMHNGPRTRYDRELAAQGLGNMICGAFGALPMTGVIVRSAVNVQAGARSRWSAVMHGVWLLVFVAFLAFLLRMIPIACLAAMLVYTGYKLIDFNAIKELWHVNRAEAGIYFVTVAVVVCVDLLSGVLTGVALSALKLLFTFSRLSVKLEIAAGQKASLRLAGAATFIRLPKLATELEKVPPGVELHVDFDHLTYIDHACLELLTNWQKQHAAQGGTLVIDWDDLHARFSGFRNGRSNNDTAISPAEVEEQVP